jgi:hypothetical protein
MPPAGKSKKSTNKAALKKTHVAPEDRPVKVRNLVVFFVLCKY